MDLNNSDKDNTILEDLSYKNLSNSSINETSINPQLNNCFNINDITSNIYKTNDNYIISKEEQIKTTTSVKEIKGEYNNVTNITNITNNYYTIINSDKYIDNVFNPTTKEVLNNNNHKLSINNSSGNIIYYNNTTNRQDSDYDNTIKNKQEANLNSNELDTINQSTTSKNESTINNYIKNSTLTSCENNEKNNFKDSSKLEENPTSAKICNEESENNIIRIDVSSENNKSLNSCKSEENKNLTLCVNDIIEVYNPNDNLTCKAKILYIESAKYTDIDEIKLNSDSNCLFKLNNNENENPLLNQYNLNKRYYIHYLNYEKRMDSWVNVELIKKKLNDYDKKDTNKTIKNKSLSNNKNYLESKDNVTHNKSNDKSIYYKSNSSILYKNKISNFNIINNNRNYVENLNNQILKNFMLTRKRSSYATKSIFEKTFEENHITKIKNIEQIYIGKFEIETWYYSPYPSEFTQNKELYICEFCLKYMKMKNTLKSHIILCNKSPPGKKIYSMIVDHNVHKEISKDTTSISVYLVEGAINKLYCQNLSLLAKLFLDHKNIYFDVAPFNFYVLTENVVNNADNSIISHIVGYFSKEISCKSEFNLACIMVLPPFQKSGYGQFLISLSYYLSKIENKIGTPEVPLSDLGKLAYKSYWINTLIEALVKYKGNLNIKELSEITNIKYEDIVFALNEIGLIKYWKGQQILQTVNLKHLEDYLKKKKLQKLHHVKFNSNNVEI